MTEQGAGRPLSPDEARVIRAIISTADITGGAALIADLEGALVFKATPWILDVKVSTAGVGVELPDGPFPARAFVPSNAAYQGEIIIWLTNGHVSGLEYSWVTDEPPTAWPGSDEIEVVPQTDSTRS